MTGRPNVFADGVLSGRPTLRTAAGEEQVGPGDVVPMPRGIEGLHTFAIATRDPFAPVPESGDAGIVEMLDLPTAE